MIVSDGGFEPKVLTIHPGDRVWWVWEDNKNLHNIVQVSCMSVCLSACRSVCLSVSPSLRLTVDVW